LRLVDGHGLAAAARSSVKERQECQRRGPEHTLWIISVAFLTTLKVPRERLPVPCADTIT
jgi:hypothetical protein